MIKLDLDKKILAYNYLANIILFSVIPLGIAPTLTGLIISNNELADRSFKLTIISLGLLLVIKTGFFTTNRKLKQGWYEWNTDNKDKIKKQGYILMGVSILLTIFFVFSDFYY